MSAITSLKYLAGLQRALENGSERAIHTFLKQYQRPLWVAFAHGWNGILIVPEFRFGRNYRADFLVLSSHSGALHTTLLELEPPKARLYLRDGTESRELRTALRQVKDWFTWVSDYPGQFHREIAEEIERVARDDRRIPKYLLRFIRAELLDPRNVVLDHYAVLIGRRNSLSPADNQRRGNEAKWRVGIEIATYDRLIDIGLRDKQFAASYASQKVRSEKTQSNQRMQPAST